VKKSIELILFSFTITTLLAGPDHQLPKTWQTLASETLDVEAFMAEREIAHVLFIRVTDCHNCIVEEVKKLREEQPTNSLVILGYMTDQELYDFADVSLGEPVLLDERYSFIRRIRLRGTPIRYTLDKSLALTEVTGED